MSIVKGKDVKLNVKPVCIALYHEHVFEGPCRFGRGEALTKEFDLMSNSELYKKFISDITAAMPKGDVHILEPVYIQHDEQFLITDDQVMELTKDVDEADFYFFTYAGRTGNIILEFAQKYRKPVAIMQACCGNTYTTAALIARGLEAYPFETWEDAGNFMKVLRVRKVLQETKVLLATRLNSNISLSAPDSFISLEQITAEWGTRFRYINAHELLDQTRQVAPDSNPTLPGRRALNITEVDATAIAKMTDDFIGGATECDMKREDVYNSIKACYTVKKMLELYECNAFTMPCPDICATRRLNEEKITFCLTHSLLGEEGIPSACEYDIPALLSMVVLSNFAKAPAYMGNTVSSPLEHGERRKLHKLIFNPVSAASSMQDLGQTPNVMLTFHAVPNRKFKGYDKEVAPYAIRSFAYSGFGATIRYDFNKDKGQVLTMARFDPSGKKLFVARGVILGGIGYRDQNCSEGVFFQVADGKDFFKKQSAFGNHIPLVYGDHFDEVVALGETMGLEVITA